MKSFNAGHAWDEQVIAQLISSIDKAPATESELRAIISLIDLTSLEGKDTDMHIRQLCARAVEAGTAAVCVYPSLVRVARKALDGSPVHLAAVAGAFPSGQSALPIRLEEVRYAIEEGADEIDMVISRGKFLEGNIDFVSQEVAAFRKQCGKVTLKVILETGELGSLEHIGRASAIALKAGADFIKTSTGKINVNATLPAVAVMLNMMSDHFSATGNRVGIKPSGGISDGDTAAQYLRLAEKVMGKEQLKPSCFRFGASRLLDQVRAKLEGKKVNDTGGY